MRETSARNAPKLLAYEGNNCEVRPEETLPAEGMEENNRNIHDAMRRTLWMVLIAVMVAVFLVVVLMRN